MSDNQYKPTVMPKDESLEQQQAHGGAPGLFRPQNPEQVDAFKKVSNVDAKDLNAQLQAQDNAKAQAKLQGGHGLQQFSHEIPHESHRSANELNANLQAQDEARRNPQNAVPGPVVPGKDNLSAFTKND